MLAVEEPMPDIPKHIKLSCFSRDAEPERTSGTLIVLGAPCKPRVLTSGLIQHCPPPSPKGSCRYSLENQCCEKNLIEGTGVVTLPGVSFGIAAEGCLRLHAMPDGTTENLARCSLRGGKFSEGRFLQLGV